MGISVPPFDDNSAKGVQKMAEKKTKITSETLVSTPELALILDVTGRRVRQLAEDGVLTKQEGGFLLVDSVRKFYATKVATGDKEEDAKIERSKNLSEAQLKAAKATVAKLEAEELKGKLHRAEDVKALTEEMIYAFRGAVMALPGRVAVDCAACGGNAAEISDVIRKEIYTMLNELADYKYDNAKYEELVRERMQWEAKEEEVDDE